MTRTRPTTPASASTRTASTSETIVRTSSFPLEVKLNVDSCNNLQYLCDWTTAGTASNVIGTVNSGDCFLYSGLKLTDDDYAWFSIAYHNGQDEPVRNLRSCEPCAHKSSSWSSRPTRMLFFSTVDAIDPTGPALFDALLLNNFPYSMHTKHDACVSSVHHRERGWLGCTWT